MTKRSASQPALGIRQLEVEVEVGVAAGVGVAMDAAKLKRDVATSKCQMPKRETGNGCWLGYE